MACSGAHIVNQVSVKDSETCLLADGTGMTAGTYQGAPNGMNPWGVVGHWRSDYNSVLAKSWTMTAVDNGNGSFTLYVVAYY